MSLDKTIKSGKEHRKPWIGQNRHKNIDPACRNHGSCDHCRDNRLHRHNKEKSRMDAAEKET